MTTSRVDPRTETTSATAWSSFIRIQPMYTVSVVLEVEPPARKTNLEDAPLNAPFTAGTGGVAWADEN